MRGYQEKLIICPHRAVVRHDKETTKVRIVFDGSAKVDQCTSLKALHSGPSLLCMIFDILLRFRLHKYILLSDIKQAFLNVGVRAEGSDFLGFLWFEDPFPDDEKVTAFRFLRVVFGLICRPFLLNATIKVHCEKYLNVWQDFVFEFLRNLYVDDSTLGFDSFEEGYVYFLKARKIMSDAGFELKKWETNLVELKEKIYDEIKDNVSNVCVKKKVLSLNWDISKDTINFYFENLVEEAFDLPMTKRSILSISARIYDPLGLLSPTSIQMKMLFQIICQNETLWDTVLEKNLQNLWLKLLNDLKGLFKLIVPRYLFNSVQENVLCIELHDFCGSSMKDYSALCYIRVIIKNGIFGNLLCEKAKVAPLKTISIPCLELLSCVLLAKLLKNVKNAIIKILK